MIDAQESKRRKVGLGLLSIVVVVFIALSGLSFVQERGRPDPEMILFQGYSAVDGKRVFQAYNCMGCHTMLGNGAYFGPDLTKIYEDGGAAWLKAFLSAPGTWPTKAVVDLRVEQLRQSGDVDVASTDAYYQQYPHVLEAVELFGGKRTVMPNLALKPDEIAALTAFFNYAAEIDTAGWPPARQADAAVVERLQAEFGVVPPTAVETAPTPASPVSLEVQGKQLAGELGCLACHSTDGTQRSGPTFKGLFGATVPLQDGSTVIVDEAYLRESILGPNAKIRQGFSAGSMPAYEGRVSPAEIDALIAYIKSLK